MQTFKANGPSENMSCNHFLFYHFTTMFSKDLKGWSRAMMVVTLDLGATKN